MCISDAAGALLVNLHVVDFPVYADAQEGPGAVAEGGGDWNQAANVERGQGLKRGRSPDEGGDERVRTISRPSNSVLAPLATSANSIVS